MTHAAFLDDDARLRCPVCKIEFNHIQGVDHLPDSEDVVIHLPKHGI
jgi:hypothetical protein